MPCDSITLSPHIRARIDQTITDVQSLAYPPDPLLSPELSLMTSQCGALVRRHGHILQEALAHALGTAPGLAVWRDVALTVPAEVDQLALAGDAVVQQVHYPLTGARLRTVRLDLFVIDQRRGACCVIEVKRGHQLDASKKRQLTHDLRCARMLGRALAGRLGSGAQKTDARAVFVYGAPRGLPAEMVLLQGALDDYFRHPVTPQLTAATTYFRDQISQRLTPGLTAMLTH